MSAFFSLKTVNLSTAAMLVAVLSCTSTFTPVAVAQNTSSAVGTFPLHGLAGGDGWINSKPITAASLKGKVVLVDFWAYSCINCIRSVPYVRAWADKYKDSGLVVIGVHTPEFDFEKQIANVQKAATKAGITYPVVLDNDYKIWNAFHNEAWPAHYFIDAKGKVRYVHLGEGDYAQSEKWIQDLLKEANSKQVSTGMVNVRTQGVQAQSNAEEVQSPETYIGYARADNFASPGGLKHDVEQAYQTPANVGFNQWALSGNWIDQKQAAILKSAGGKIYFKFHARDLNLVLGAGANGKPIRFRVTVDGHAPQASHGVDTDAQGNGTVAEYRLYQLVRQSGEVEDHVFTIEFLDPGVQAFSFTFG